ncbi:MAG: SDR family NAD(P)-dependent oxidoreductase, partial [SAR202 cluster bacterium]|nr:SDR family NAD(P)-dependent oxidoreductase [SAR202 cluster bacterium]
MKTGLEGKTVMISGASRNIGKQTAILMAEEGANLVLCTQKSIEPLQETAHE